MCEGQARVLQTNCTRKRVLSISFVFHSTFLIQLCSMFPGNEDGEPFIPDRQIRINEKPLTKRGIFILAKYEMPSRIDLVSNAFAVYQD